MSHPPSPGQDPYQTQPYQQGQYQQPYQGHYAPGLVAPNSAKATTSLVLGIVSLVACGLLLGIPAMIVARQAKREIRESHGRVGGEGLATAGFWTGLIGTVWSVIGILLVVGVVVIGINAADTSCTTVTDADGTSSIECG